MLVFDQDDNWPSGHVAIVTRVAARRIYFVQQNVGPVVTDSLALDGANHIGDEGGSGIHYPPVRGWLHSPHNGGYATGNLGGYVANSRTGGGIAGALVILSAALALHNFSIHSCYGQSWTRCASIAARRPYQCVGLCRLSGGHCARAVSALARRAPCDDLLPDAPACALRPSDAK